MRTIKGPFEWSLVSALVLLGLAIPFATIFGTPTARGHDPATDNAAALAAVQGELADLTTLVGDLGAELAVLRADLAAVDAKPLLPFPRHGLQKVNWLPDPFDVVCATTLDVAVPCDPTSETRDAEGDDLAWDDGVCLNGTLAPVNEVATYTPAAGFSGTDSCTADVRDDGGYALEANITVTVDP